MYSERYRPRFHFTARTHWLNDPNGCVYSDGMHHLWRLTSVTALPDARLRVSFIDGTAGEVDMRVFLRNPQLDGTIFEPLRDPAVFAQARVVLGAVQWPNGADLAPDAMYDAIRDPGVWVLD
jgi:hypothetical protein